MISKQIAEKNKFRILCTIGLALFLFFGCSNSSDEYGLLTASRATGTNVLQNAGFETGSVSPWTNGVIIDTSNCRTGSYCGKVTQAAPSSDQTVTGLMPNTSYTFSGYMKVATAGDRVSIGVKNYGGSELYADVTVTSYTQASVTFTTGASNTSAVVYMYKSSGSGAAYGDDFRLLTNRVINAGFETGSVNPWTNGVIIDTSNCRTGSYCGKVTQAAPSSDQTVTGLLPNTSYTFSGYMKVATAGERVSIGVKNYGGSELYADITVTGYTQASVTFTTGVSNTSAVVYMYKSSGSGAAYGDDFNMMVDVTTTTPSTGLQNPGFETGSVSPWTNGVVISSSNCRTGTYCGKVTQTAPSSDQTVTGLLPNTSYTFSGYMKVATAGERVSIGVKNYGGSELYADVTVTGYTQASVTFTTGASNTSAVVYMYKSSGSGAAYGDDFSLSVNGLTNSGFETGSVSPWTNGVVIDTINKRSGSYCGKVTQTAPSSDQTVTGLQPNTTYTFSGYVKVATAGERVVIGVKNYGGSELYYDITSTSYTYGSVTFTTGSSNNSAVVYMYKASGTGAAYGDDFNLTAGGGSSSSSSSSSSSGGVVPYGGPSGYSSSNVLMNDVFGSNKAGANITSVSQFNPSTPYGLNGTGWDLWSAAYGQSQGTYALATIESAALRLDLASGSNPARFMCSHLEFLPDAGNTYYIEIRSQLGRGDYGSPKKSWPAFWLFMGNGPGHYNNLSEIDFMETFPSQPDDPFGPDGHQYTAFRSVHHPGGVNQQTYHTGIDLTTSYNVYGCQLRYSGGYIYYDIYFNGVFKYSSTTGLAWQSSPPTILVGWNDGTREPNYTPLYIDYIRVWRK